MDWEGEDKYEFLAHLVHTQLCLGFVTKFPVTYAAALQQTNKPSLAQKTRRVGILCSKGTNVERGRQLRGVTARPGRRRAPAARGLGFGQIPEPLPRGWSGAGLDAPHPTLHRRHRCGPAPCLPGIGSTAACGCVCAHCPGQEPSVSAPN